MSAHETTIRVRYAETDQMGIVYHANFLIWMEVARVDLCKAAGMRYRDLEQSAGVALAVVEANCRYVRPARFDDEIVISTVVQEVNSRVVRFGYEMRRKDETQIVASGFTKHVFVNREMRPSRLPPEFLPFFSGLAQHAEELP